MQSSTTERTFPIGAELTEEGTSFRVWAPECSRLEVVFEAARSESALKDPFPLEREANGYFSGTAPASLGAHGSLYKLRLNGDQSFPDPLSRYQPDGPHGPSQIWDGSQFPWTDQAWRGVSLAGQVLYELHVGTFSPQGTYAGAQERLGYLRDVGVTTIELMPVPDFPGNFGWGYDGVALFAPFHAYGTPDDLRRLVNAAHEHGLGVMLDVVYNHLGPDGNYLSLFAKDFFTKKHCTPWGQAINFDAPGAAGVREFFKTNAAYWIREFHFDGLRFDASQSMLDDGSQSNGVHILKEINDAVREAAGDRSTILVAENDERDTQLMRRDGLDGIWNDDLHHSVRVALTGRRSSYFSPFQGSAQELVSVAKHGLLYMGQSFLQNEGQMLQKEGSKRRTLGHSTRGVPLFRFINYIENHDQISIAAHGERPRTMSSAALYRAMSAYLLLGPGTPMLFQGQEFGSSSTFPYFSDHKSELNDLVRKGRWEYLSQFLNGEKASDLPDPGATETVEKARLQWAEVEAHAQLHALYKDLIALRHKERLFSDPALSVDGSLLAADCFVLRYSLAEEGREANNRAGESMDAEEGDRMLVVNLGKDFSAVQIAEPLLAPPEGCGWEVIFSSQEIRYGGTGTGPFEDEAGWHVAAQTAIYLKPVRK